MSGMMHRVLGLGLFVLVALSLPVRAADDAKMTAFLKATGFDVALESMRIGAQDAPQMLGLQASDFGSLWTRMADEVFDADEIKADAMNFLQRGLTPEMLDHAVTFYASDLGQRLVAVENAAHSSEDDGGEANLGEALVAEMVQSGSPRLAYLKRMNHAIDPENVGIRAAQEVQVRFLLAAADAGVISAIDEATLRSLMAEQQSEMALEIEKSSLTSAAAVYESFSDEDVKAYAEALEEPLMQKVYELMNGVQYAIMADRYERLALKMAGLSPAEEL